MLFFFILRGVLVFNTPDVVHVPRITIQQNEIPSEDHYQFRMVSNKWKLSFTNCIIHCYTSQFVYYLRYNAQAAVFWWSSKVLLTQQITWRFFHTMTGRRRTKKSSISSVIIEISISRIKRTCPMNLLKQHRLELHRITFVTVTWPCYTTRNNLKFKGIPIKFFLFHTIFPNVTLLSESAFFYFIFDPDFVMDYFKTKLTNEELDEGGRCSHLRKFDEKFHIAECCITDLPEGLRASDFPKREFWKIPF